MRRVSDVERRGGDGASGDPPGGAGGAVERPRAEPRPGEAAAAVPASTVPKRVLARGALAYLLVLGAVASALRFADPYAHDDFPLSSFPMFARGRKERTYEMAHALAVLPGGARVPVEPALVGTREVLQSKATVEGALGRGQGAALCAEIAARLPSGPDETARATHVELVTSVFDVVAYFEEGRRAPLSRAVHARCAVPGAPAGAAPSRGGR